VAFIAAVVQWHHFFEKKCRMKEQEKVLTSTQQSNAIVSCFFLAQVRDRLMGEGELIKKEDPFHGAADGGDHIPQQPPSQDETHSRLILSLYNYHVC
jgi:hypothetical protein